VLRGRSVRIAFGLALREARDAVGFSQERVALEAGIDRAHVSDLERGQFQPTLLVIFRLAAALGVQPKDLVARTQHLLQ
jgi:XRE family transcriptional regulator, regulator of sulfur utilization